MRAETWPTGRLIHVAIDERGGSVAAPPLIPETGEDRRRMAEGEARPPARRGQD